MCLIALVSCEQTPDNNTPKENPVLTSISTTSFDYSFFGGSGEVAYSLEGVAEGKRPDATASEPWVTDIVVGETITFVVEQNTTTSARTATLTVSYADQSFDVSISQDGGLTPTVEFVAKAINGQTYESNLYNYFVILSEKGVTSWSEVAVGEVYYRFDIYAYEPAGNPVILPQAFTHSAVAITCSAHLHMAIACA